MKGWYDMVKVRVKVMRWSEAFNRKIPTLVELEFDSVDNEEELRMMLMSGAKAKRMEEELDALDAELSCEAHGITSDGISQAYHEDTHRKGTKGGGEATGTRKTARECKAREKSRAEDEGNWDLNL